MNPSLALILWLVLVVGLFWLDPAKEPDTSSLLWVPLTWFFFLASRPPAMWLGLSYGDTARALEDGNPIDRTIFSLLMLAAIVILARRSFNWSDFINQNTALALFVAFAMISVIWSDFPFATFKKWFRDTGVIMAVLVVLSDPRPAEAVRTVFRRLCYLIVPLSIVLVKYYPALGKMYSPWGGQEYTGVSTSKNMLGVLCLVSGIFFFWDTITRWHQRREVQGKRVILVNLVFMGMTLWLLNLSQSSTSMICLVIGWFVIAAAHSRFGRRHPGCVRTLAPASFVLYLVLSLGLGMGGKISQAVGKSADMSDRTHIWEVLLSVPINPLLGTGYQSFWIGPRLQWVWSRLNGDNVASAHNGYLQIYLDLGIVGLLFLAAFLIATYRKTCRRLNPLTPLGSLSLGLWTLLLFYNISEASFEINLLFVIFLLAAIPVPEEVEDGSLMTSPLDEAFASPSARIDTFEQAW